MKTLNPCCFTNDSCGFQFPDHIRQFLHLWVLMSKPFLLMSQVVSTLGIWRGGFSRRTLETQNHLWKHTVKEKQHFNPWTLLFYIFTAEGFLVNVNKREKRGGEKRWIWRGESVAGRAEEVARKLWVEDSEEEEAEEEWGMNNMDMEDKTDVTDVNVGEPFAVIPRTNLS